MTITGSFFIMPLLLNKHLGTSSLWKTMVLMAIIGTSLMFYFSKRTNEKSTTKTVLIGFGFQFAGMTIPIFSTALLLLILAFILVYAGYCINSPVLPAAASRYPGLSMRSTVMGMFNSSQFLGSAAGGIISGHMLERFSQTLLFLFLALIQFSGAISIIRFKNFNLSKIMSVSNNSN
jgi:predicted MFS family arabinose efflux permease